MTVEMTAWRNGLALLSKHNWVSSFLSLCLNAWKFTEEWFSKKKNNIAGMYLQRDAIETPNLGNFLKARQTCYLKQMFTECNLEGGAGTK